MRQYLDVKSKYPDAILFFRLGDFYEMFYEDAVYVSRALSLTLTSRDKGKEDPTPMCGVPHHSARGYIQRLTELGHRVALCEQLEDPKLVKGMVKRGVVRVITPGVILDEESLEPRTPNYVAAVAGEARDGYGLAFADVTTGDFRATSCATTEGLLDELARAEPREILLARQDGDLAAIVRRAYGHLAQTVIEAGDETPPLQTLTEVLGTGFDRPGLDKLPLVATAAARVLRYVRATQLAAPLPLCAPGAVPAQRLPHHRRAGARAPGTGRDHDGPAPAGLLAGSPRRHGDGHGRAPDAQMVAVSAGRHRPDPPPPGRRRKTGGATVRARGGAQDPWASWATSSD
jgi:DNA mismatch repair protein MutS